MKAKPIAASKKRITQEWSQEFPALGIYKPMWLMRIVGLFVQGICLDRDSGNDNYLPTFHLHNLANQKVDFISLTLRTPLRSERTNYSDRLTLARHEKCFSEIVSRFRAQCPLSLEGDLTCDDLISAYQNYIAHGQAETAYPLNEFYDMVCIYIWCGRRDDARFFFRECQKKIKLWPDQVTQFSQDGILDFCRLESAMEHPFVLEDRVKKATRALGLDKLPVARLG